VNLSAPVKTLATLLVVAFLLPMAPMLHAQTRLPPDGHLRLIVHNGTGDGDSYYVGQTVPVGAQTPSGFEFVKWFKTEGDGSLSAPLQADGNFIMGRDNSEIAATFAKLESWFPPGPEGNTKGLLLPKPQSGQARRLEQRLRITLNRGSSARPPYSEVWGALRVKMKWKEATNVRFFTAETGGQEIANEDVLPKDSFKPKAENVYEASIWYEGNLTQEQIAQMSQSGNTPKVTIQMNFVVEGNDKPTSWSGSLLPADIDFVHPATGEMNENRENSEGGYIAIRKDEETPVTKLKLHKLEGIASAEFKLTFGPSKIKIWKDKNRTQTVTSDQTTFPASVDTELFLEGVEKSDSARDVEIGLKVKIGSIECSVLTSRATVVQSECKTTIQAFIPYLWVDVPLNWLPNWIPGTDAISNAVAIGDNRGYDDSLSRSFRVRQTMVVIPFADLASDQTKTNDAIPAASEHYRKSTSVPQGEQSQEHGYYFTSTPELIGGPSDGLITGPYETIVPVSSQKVSITTNLWANEGIFGIASLPIRWNMTFTFDISDPVLPRVSLTGQRSGFPAFEVYVQDSDETNIPVYQWKPDTSRGVWSLGLFESFSAQEVVIIP